MKRMLLVVAYDGTAYHGWQVQANASPTIEEVLNRALSSLTGEAVAVIGASRTDAGVHALGNAAVFDSATRIPPAKIAPAVNQWLPEDVVVQSSREVSMDFHPLRAASQKTYAYHILNREVNLPTARRQSYFVYRPLDIAKMREAAAHLVGEHDFSSFCSAGTRATDMVRTVLSLTVEQEGDFITVRVKGNGFLYNMVRIIVGTLLLAGEGKWEPERVGEALAARDRQKAGPTAPAHGLVLEEVKYLDFD